MPFLWGGMSLGGEIIELVANISADSIYAQCDVDESDYHFLEAFNNHRKNWSALSAEKQKGVIKEWETLRKSTAG